MVAAPADRDRDELGRPKSRRPRDELGRPMPPGRVDRLPDLPRASTPEEALVVGLECFNAGRFFQAHEVWEEAWHVAPQPERDFWQGLTQIAVGLTHRQRGNARGATTLLRRGAARLRRYGARHRGIPCGELVSFAEEAADIIDRQGIEAPVSIPPIPPP